MSLVCSRMSSLCHSYVFVCHPFVTRMYSYVILLLLVCICMTSFYYSYFLACHTYVTRVYLYLILLLLVCTRVSSFVTLITYLLFYHEPAETQNAFLEQQETSNQLYPQESFSCYLHFLTNVTQYGFLSKKVLIKGLIQR